MEKQISDAQMARVYFALEQPDLDALTLLGLVIQDVRHQLIEDFYEMILSWPEVQATISSESLQRAKKSQDEYFNELFSGQLDSSYFARRRRIGAVHDEHNVRPYWYLAAYSYYLNRLHAFMVPRLQGRPLELQTRVLQAITKIVLFDASLAWEEYTSRRDIRSDEHIRLIAGQQNMFLREMEATEEETRKALSETEAEWDSLVRTLGEAIPPQARDCISRGLQRLHGVSRSLQERMQS